MSAHDDDETPPLLRLVPDVVRSIQAYGAPPPHTGIKLDANESPWAPSHDAMKALIHALSDVELHRYPDPAQEALRHALVEVHGGRADDYVAGSGSDEVIALLVTALRAPRGGRAEASVLFPTPTFVMFDITTRAHGAAPVGVPLDAHWQLDVPAMRAALARELPNLVFLASPNNPTGAAFRESDVRALIESDAHALFVIDEAYAAYQGRSLRHLADAYPNVAMMGTLSKVGYAAARVGWVRLPAVLAGEVDKVRQPYNLSALAQAVAVTVLGTLGGETRAFAARVMEERARLAEALSAAGLLVFPSDANFLLTRPKDAARLAAHLRERGIAIKAYAHGALAGHARITVGTPQENDALLAAMESFR